MFSFVTDVSTAKVTLTVELFTQGLSTQCTGSRHCHEKTAMKKFIAMTNVMASSLQLQVASVLLQILQSSECVDNILSTEDVCVLLGDDSADQDGESQSNLKMVGYPTNPMYLQISNRLCDWMETGNFPLDRLPKHYLLEETKSFLKSGEVREEVEKRVKDMSVCWIHCSSDERKDKLEGILKVLGRRGLMDLLGVRTTIGSHDLWPPTRSTLENTFNSKHRPDSIKPCNLSVGARALSKHCHRDMTTSWWGVAKGSEAAKNEHAFKIVTRILNEATWINIHSLPNDVVTLEVRQKDGYGARWSHDGLNFRGFVEPMMENGHEVGWRH